MASTTSDLPAPQQALSAALLAVLLPLARLAVGQGLPFAAVEELLKRSFVQAAREAQPDPAAARMVSRISTATGINRREVTRLYDAEPDARPQPRSVVAELFAHWTTAAAFRDRRGAPRDLPRQGKGASFETLAHAVTRDVHARTLLDELLRLGVATHDAARDTVTLQRDAFVPRGDALRMLEFFAANVGDHVSAAAQNVLTDGKRHFEQAVFAHELSAESMQEVRSLVTAQWQALIEAMVPRLEQLIAADATSDRRCDQRLRVGLYSFHESAPAAPPAPDAPPPRRARRAGGNAAKDRP